MLPQILMALEHSSGKLRVLTATFCQGGEDCQLFFHSFLQKAGREVQGLPICLVPRSPIGASDPRKSRSLHANAVRRWAWMAWMAWIWCLICETWELFQIEMRRAGCAAFRHMTSRVRIFKREHNSHNSHNSSCSNHIHSLDVLHSIFMYICIYIYIYTICMYIFIMWAAS